MLPILRNDAMFAPASTRPFNRQDSLFGRVIGDDGAPSRAWSWAPVGVWQNDDHIFIEIDMPGMSDNDIELTVHNDRLYIRGERKPEEARQYLYNGRSYGRFERTIVLPDGVQADEVTANLTNGVLHVQLPKRPEAKPKRIAIKAT